MLAMLEQESEQWSQLQQPLLTAFSDVFARSPMDRALVAEMMVLPGEKYIAEMLEQVDVHRIRTVREALKLQIAVHNEDQLLKHYRECVDNGEYRLDPEAIASRRLKNVCLAYLLHLEKPEYFEHCKLQFTQAGNMTDQIACLQMVVHYRHDLRDQIVTQFYQQWKDTALVVDKWFSVLGSSSVENALDEIKPLFSHLAYTLANPNRARSLLGSTIANSTAFHQVDGAGYALAAQKILELDAINPQVAARLANPFVHWRKLVAQQGQLMKSEVENMLTSSEMSNDLNELLTTSLTD